MGEKVVGILGGMGPEATIDFFTRIVKGTRVKKDQDHLRIIIVDYPQNFLSVIEYNDIIIGVFQF